MKKWVVQTAAVCAMLLAVRPCPLRGNLWDYYAIIQAGGMVQDVSRIENEAQDYLRNLNKLNFVTSSVMSARQKFIAWQSLEKTFGDGSGVPAYVPRRSTDSPDIRREIARYAENLPRTPIGASLRDYLRRQQKRDQVILAYSARLRAAAQAAGRSSLPLDACAALGNSLRGFGYDNRLLQINEEAEADLAQGVERDAQLKVRESRLFRQEADAPWRHD
jgi:hypothetical protein